MKRKGIRALVITLVSLAAAGGIAFGAVKLLQNRGGEVSVYPASSFITGADWATSAQTDGIVSTDRIQSVYVSDTQVITDIYVEEGQTVKAGDTLLSFDTTLSEVNLHRQAIKVDQLELDIQNAEAELAKINTYRIGTGSSGGYSYTPAETEPEVDPVPVPYMPFERTVDALGTVSDPLIFLWNDESVFSAGFIGSVMGEAMAARAAVINGTDPEPGAPIPVDPVAPTQTPAETAPPATEPPPATESPAQTEAPAATEAPAQTETPAATETPVETEAPVQTETPTETEPPAETEAPPEPVAPAEQEAPASPAEPAEAESPADPEGEELALRMWSAGPSRLLAPARKLSPAPVESMRPEIDPALLEELLDPWVYVVFEVREGDAENGSILRVWEMAIRVDADTGVWSFRMLEPSYDPGDGEFDADDFGFDDFYFDDTVYYTASEIAQMKTETNQKLQDLNLRLKQARLEYERLEYELSNGEVVAKIDGVVKTLRDPDEAKAENKPLVLVSGGGGYYVTAVLGEFELGSMDVGDTVTVQSWESGEMIDGEITEISEYPDESNQYWYYSEGNQNVSKYPFKVFVSEDASLREGESVTLSYSAAGSTGGSGVFLEQPFIRQENGKSYIFVMGEDGLLEKRFVRTGQNLWGSYIEILDGLTEDDYIAFPYGRQTVDGAKTRIAEADELWSSMYYG